MASHPKSAPLCALCPSPATDTIDVSSGAHLPVCDACRDGLTHTPTVPMPWEEAFNPAVHSLHAAVLDALVEGLRGADDPDVGAHEWVGVTIANDRFDTGEAA